MDYGEGLTRLERRARVATIVLWLFAAVAVLTAGAESMEALGLLNVAVDTGPMATVAALIYLAFTVVFVISVIVVAMWIHRAHANLGEVGVDALEFTPGWAVGWYFIPFANLVKPFQAMRELWNASHAESDHYGVPAPGAVKAWWAAWIVGNILSSVGTRILLMGEGGASSLVVGNAVGAAGTVGIVIAAFLLMKIISAVTKAQRGGVSAAPVFA